MKEVNVNGYKEIGYAVTVEVSGNTEEYAMSFLHIFNNVRGNDGLLKVRNYFDSNDITVYCDEDSKDGLIRYLKTFGKITGCHKVIVYKIEEPYYDLDEYYDIVII